MTKSALNWFELPVTDLARATRFYEALLGIDLRSIPDPDPTRARSVFPYDAPGTGGALVCDPRRKPSAEGSVIYLDASGKLDECLARAKKAGGEVIVGRTAIGPNGSFAHVKDSEGNVVGLHEPAVA